MATPPRLGALAAALACAAAAAPAPASADMLAYTAGRDVWVENADGSKRARLTTDGATGTYVTPSPNDAGDVTAFRLAGFSAAIQFFPAGGGAKTVNLMPTRGTGALIGPFGARMVPDSPAKLVAYTYARNDTWAGTQGPFLNVVPANAPGSPTSGGGIAGAFVATPHRDRFVSTALDGRLYYGRGEQADPVWQDLTGDGLKFTSGEVSRDGTKLLSIVSTGGAAGALALSRLSGPMPATMGATCVIATTGGASRAALSPDGDRVAWRDDAGLHVAKATAVGEDCPVTEKRTIAADGDYPAFSRYTMADPPSADPGGGSGGGTPDGGTQITPPAPAPPAGTARRTPGTAPAGPTVRASTRSLRTVLRRGLTLRLAGLPRGRTVVRVASGRTLLARRTVTARNGAARLTIRLTHKQRAVLRGRRTVTLRVSAGVTTRTVVLR